MLLFLLNNLATTESNTLSWKRKENVDDPAHSEFMYPHRTFFLHWKYEQSLVCVYFYSRRLWGYGLVWYGMALVCLFFFRRHIIMCNCMHVFFCCFWFILSLRKHVLLHCHQNIQNNQNITPTQWKIIFGALVFYTPIQINHSKHNSKINQ